MNHRKMIAALAAVALVGSTGAAAQGVGETFGSGTSLVKDIFLYEEATTDEIVEGHTVYTKIDRGETDAAAMAVLVEDERVNDVLWFDDSFLHQERRPIQCSGSVWATHSQGVLLPPTLLSNDKTYEISTWHDGDGDGRDDTLVPWKITEFEGPAGTQLSRAWGVIISCPGPDEAYQTSGPLDADVGFNTYPPSDGGDDDNDATGDNPTPADIPEESDEIERETLHYNAFLWFEFGPGHVDIPFTLIEDEYHGCDADLGVCGTDAETADTTEGNSHPYNPNMTAPADLHNHTTAQMDIYFQEHEDVAHGTVEFTNNISATPHQHP